MEMLRRATVRVVSTIGIPSLIAILLGVPAMIGLITQIWNALSPNQKPIVAACLALIIIAIGLFIYGQTGRQLMVIPKTIYRMNERAKKITGNLALDPNSAELSRFLSLVGLVGHSFEKITDYETFKMRAPDLIREAQKQGNRIKKDTKQSARVVRFIHEGYVRKALDNDKEYQRLKSRLMSKWPIIPTMELSTNIIAYNKFSVIRCSCALMLTIKNDGDSTWATKILEIVPMEDLLDANIEMENIDEKLGIMLAKVNQSIDQYYRGNSLKEDKQSR